ncbi:MAG: DUF3854 domain-containing protein [Planctomycetes bacterium]|nr:DUF3854 domain-containing protein [Planctomycetota bacterium]
MAMISGGEPQQTRAELLPQHAQLIEASGIASDVALERRYRSIEDPDELKRLGFAESQCRVPGLLIPIHDVRGNVTLHQYRPDRPRVRGARPVKYETPKGARLVIDVPPRARCAIDDPGVALLITEGARKADAAVSRGLCCVALLGVWGWRGKSPTGASIVLPDFESIHLKGRRVIVAFDSDVTTKREVRKALARLRALLSSRGAVVQVVLLPSGANGEKVGLDDYLVQGKSLSDLEALPDPERPEGSNESQASQCSDSTTGAIAERLVQFAANDELFQDERGVAHAAVVLRGVRRIVRLGTEDYRRVLAGRCFDTLGKVPSREATLSAIRVLESKVLPDGLRRPLHNRFAESDGAIWIDLADERNRAVRIDSKGWAVVEPPILFRRLGHQRSLPTPARDGDIELLRRFVRLASPNDWPLLRAYVVNAAHPTVPLPILCLHGGKGTTKSTAAELIRALLDPSIARHLEMADRLAELAQQLDHHAVPVFDNVSSLPQSIGDLLCKAATGGTFSKRQLFTDDDDCFFNLKCSPILTSIVLPTRQTDLLDRIIDFEFTEVPPRERRERAALMEEFEALKPRIFGGILDLLVGALAIHPTLPEFDLPRMADFARWAAAVNVAAGGTERELLENLQRNVAVREGHVLDCEPLLHAIIGLVDDSGGHWRGTATQLLETLYRRDGRRSGNQGLPRNINALSRQLREFKQTLAALGVEIAFSASHHNGRPIELTKLVSRSNASESSRIAEVENRPGITAGMGARRSNECVPSNVRESSRPNGAIRAFRPPDGSDDIGAGRDS